MNKILWVLVAAVALLMLVVMVTDTGSGEVAGPSPPASGSRDAAATSPATVPATAAASRPGLDKVLAQLASRTNSTLPMMVDRNTRWDTTMGGPGKNFSYFYTLPGHSSTDLDPANLREEIVPQVKGNVCGNKDMRQMFNAGVTAHYIYRANDGVEVVRLDIAPADCGVTPDPSFSPESLFGPA